MRSFPFCINIKIIRCKPSLIGYQFFIFCFFVFKHIKIKTGINRNHGLNQSMISIDPCAKKSLCDLSILILKSTSTIPSILYLYRGEILLMDFRYHRVAASNSLSDLRWGQVDLSSFQVRESANIIEDNTFSWYCWKSPVHRKLPLNLLNHANKFVVTSASKNIVSYPVILMARLSILPPKFLFLISIKSKDYT